MSPLKPKIITPNGVITSALSGILLSYFYYNYNSKYIIEPYSKYYSKFINKLSI